MRRRRDDGSAVLEFVWLAVLLLVPLVYIVLAAVTVQRTAFGLTTAAREAGRAYATAGSDDEGERRAEIAAQLAMRDQGVQWAQRGRLVSCGDCTYAGGSTFSVDVRARVRLPLIPKWLCGERCVAGITVSAHHRERLDCYSGTGATATSC